MKPTTIGYSLATKSTEDGFAGDDDEAANTPEFLEEEEWSHVDSLLRQGYGGQALDRTATGNRRHKELGDGDEWSHVDSNHGPPACEKGQGTVRHRPPTSQAVDRKRIPKKR
jgi:hypothetical protein